MIYKVPFVAISKAVYAVLSDTNNHIGLEWFDSAVPIYEIEDYFKSQAEFAYGIFGAADADWYGTAHCSWRYIPTTKAARSLLRNWKRC